jgi:hypothetical protein
MLNADHGLIAGSLPIDFTPGIVALQEGIALLRDDALQPAPWMDPET